MCNLDQLVLIVMMLLVTACSDSCAIDDGEEVVLTGGVTGGGLRPKITETRVTRYNMEGQATHLPSLNTARYDHACGTIRKSDGTTVKTSQWWIRINHRPSYTAVLYRIGREN